MKRSGQLTSVIFDLAGVAFTLDKIGLCKKIGGWRVLKYMLKHRKNPLSRTFEVMRRMERDDEHGDYPAIMYKGNRLPRCISEVQLGLKTNKEITGEISEYIAKLDRQGYFISPLERQVVEDLINLSLNIGSAAHVLKPVKTTLKLVEELKDRGEHKLFVLSNLDHETFDHLFEQYADFFSCFDGMVISSKVNKIKPHNAIYEHLLDTYSLDPQECVFIDDQYENITAAQQLGIHGIVYDDHKKLEKALQQLGVL